MQVSKERLEPTKTKLTVTADSAFMTRTKDRVLKAMGRDVKVQGFRPGKAPQALIEKQLDPSSVQTEFLEFAVNELYADAVSEEKVRPVAPPEINITKFVPFTTLEFTAEVESVGDIKLADYKKIKLAAPEVKVTADDVKEVIENLRTRAAEKKEVKRESRDGDQVWIDFKGVDAKTKEAIDGADGTDYPLVIGSNTFIPGFEPNLVGLKPGEEKEFTLTFPKEYGVAALQSKKVTFTVTLKKVEEVVKPKADDAFAATVGPFKSLSELKADIKKQLETEKRQQAETAYENELLTKIAEKTTVAIPEALIDEEIERMEQDERRNLVYRGQTWEEHLEAEGVSEQEHRDRNRDQAHLRVKAGLVLGVIAEEEGVEATPQELELRIQLLKGQYTDPAMQAELDKPENRRDIASRLLTEKTLTKLKQYASGK